MFKQQKELERKIKLEHNGILKERGFSIKVIMFRDYLAKLDLLDENNTLCSRFNLYYSPKRKSFKITFEKVIDEKIKNLLTDIFEGTKLPKDSYNAFDFEYQAYVDGSYINSNTGYGAVILKLGIPIKKISGHLDASDGLRQVSGELQAVREVLKYCQENNIQEIALFYDYTGIKEWAEDTWKANNDVTKAYKAFMKKNSVKIQWFKVKAHSGNVFNEMADMLAKKGAKSESESGV
ncbi:MAG: RNase H family protein [Thermotogota bacterium]|nr:RNase H family protein [Thermotogota bacterium]